MVGRWFLVMSRSIGHHDRPFVTETLRNKIANAELSAGKKQVMVLRINERIGNPVPTIVLVEGCAYVHLPIAAGVLFASGCFAWKGVCE